MQERNKIRLAQRRDHESMHTEIERVEGTPFWEVCSIVLLPPLHLAFGFDKEERANSVVYCRAKPKSLFAQTAAKNATAGEGVGKEC